EHRATLAVEANGCAAGRKVDVRREQRRRGRRRQTLLAQRDQQRRRQSAAGGIAGYDQRPCSAPREQGAIDAQRILERRWKRMFRSEPISRGERVKPTECEGAGHGSVRARAAGEVTAPVKIYERGDLGL